MQKERCSFRLSKQSIDYLKEQAERYAMSESKWLNLLLESLSARTIKDADKKTDIND